MRAVKQKPPLAHCRGGRGLRGGVRRVCLIRAAPPLGTVVHRIRILRTFAFRFGLRNPPVAARRARSWLAYRVVRCSRPGSLKRVPRSSNEVAAQPRMRSSGRVVEGARLESVYTVTPYRGFESLLLRHFAGIMSQAQQRVGGYPPWWWRSSSFAGHGLTKRGR